MKVSLSSSVRLIYVNYECTAGYYISSFLIGSKRSVIGTYAPTSPYMEKTACLQFSFIHASELV